jgi:hypothetical protein
MRKRQRYTVEMQDGTRQVILAYDGAGADSYYRRRGYDVKRVTKGDYRKTQALREAATGGFTIDRAALKDACDLLGLKLPVRLRYNSRVGRTMANHRFWGDYHDVMLKSYLTPEEASTALWHELTHAMQAERAGTLHEWLRIGKAEHGLYEHAPTEIEARDMQATMKDVMLCR